MPDPMDELLQYAENFECPVPTPRPPFAYDMLMQVPGLPDTPLEQLWQPGDAVELQVREGIIDAAGGGACAIWRARTIRPGTEGSPWTGSQASAPDCLPVPEPDFAATLIGFCLLVMLWSYLRNT